MSKIFIMMASNLNLLKIHFVKKKSSTSAFASQRYLVLDKKTYVCSSIPAASRKNFPFVIDSNLCDSKFQKENFDFPSRTLPEPTRPTHSRPVVITTFTCGVCTSVHLYALVHFSKFRKTKQLSKGRIVIATGRTVGLVEGIIDGTHVLSHIYTNAYNDTYMLLINKPTTVTTFSQSS